MIDTSAILGGEHDDQLLDLHKAIVARATHADVAWRWSVTWQDVTITEDDLTVDEAFELEALTGGQWSDVKPIESVHHVRSLLRVALTSRHGLSGVDADKRLASLTAHEAQDAVERYQVSPRPLGSNGPPPT